VQIEQSSFAFCQQKHACRNVNWSKKPLTCYEA